ncbi:hypothetical protein BDV25DRAFT_159827 [Aspergillus avenaceus]|uniref:Uncharacterized protein n=1 Tax=Aspergillus avenaceus TaxID=36643 RepID=A0A5N6TMQ6_ASPAV|nr:hypothetical protein BDV25DRAFT_159827 [Aspergillus avenaceus]
MSLPYVHGEVLTAEELVCLEDDAIILPQHPSLHGTGKRQVSASLISSPSTISTHSSTISSSSSSSASIRTFNFQPSTISTEIPLIREGPAILEYIGFDAPTSHDIFHRYAARPFPNECPDSLLDYACGQVSHLNLARYAELPLDEAMTRIGVKAQIRAAIADPEFTDLLYTEGLVFWLEDTLKTNYATLLSRQHLLKRHAHHRLAHKKKRRASLEDIFRPQETLAVTATINMTSRDFNLPENHVAIREGDPPALSNHVTLYKGKAFSGLQTTRRIIRDDGTVDFIPLSSPICGDFNSIEPAYYWTPEKDTAERYRAWASLRCPDSETCIIQIQLSRPFLNSLKSEANWFSDNWKEFVWCCRQGQPVPDRLDHLLNAELIWGHICTGHTDNLLALPGFAHMTRDHLLRRYSTGRPAPQWMFRLSTGQRLANEVKGKLHFDIFAATK